MAYYKIVETIPVGRRKVLSDKFVDTILVSKNDVKMPSGLAKTILYHWQQGILTEDTGLAALFESAILLEPEKTMKNLEGELWLTNTAKQLIMKAGK